jgi:hypothetical protein
MTRARLKAALLLVAVLLVGAVGGGAVATTVAARRVTALFEGSPKDTMARLYGFVLHRRLHLSAQQQRDVEAVVREDHAELAKLMQTIEPRLAELRHRRHARIRALLTAEQQRGFDALAARFEARHREELDVE